MPSIVSSYNLLTLLDTSPVVIMSYLKGNTRGDGWAQDTKKNLCLSQTLFQHSPVCAESHRNTCRTSTSISFWFTDISDPYFTLFTYPASSIIKCGLLKCYTGNLWFLLILQSHFRRFSSKSASCQFLVEFVHVIWAACPSPTT